MASPRPTMPPFPLAFLPGVTIIISHLAFVCWGITVLSTETALRTDGCGRATHAYKYATVNSAFALFFLVTFFLMPSGGESARARAVLCLIIYWAFSVWGVLMQLYMTSVCDQILSQVFKGMHLFLWYSIGHNLCFAVFITCHEWFLGEWIGYDLLVVFELHNRKAGIPSVPEPAFYPAPTSMKPVSLADATAPITPEQIKVEYDAVLKSPTSAAAATKQPPPALKITP